MAFGFDFFRKKEGPAGVNDPENPINSPEMMAKRQETMEILKKGSLPEKAEGDGSRDLGKEISEELSKESFSSLYKAFSEDILVVRNMTAEYDDLEDERLRELQGNEILDEAEKIRSEISAQIEATKDIQEKSDYDKLIMELDNVIKGVSGKPDLKQANG